MIFVPQYLGNPEQPHALFLLLCDDKAEPVARTAIATSLTGYTYLLGMLKHCHFISEPEFYRLLEQEKFRLVPEASPDLVLADNAFINSLLPKSKGPDWRYEQRN